MKVKDQASLPLGIVVERRDLDNRWKPHAWLPVAVIAGAGPMSPEGAWRELRRGEGWVQFHAGTLPLELFPKETEGYKLNLSQQPPCLYIVLRASDDADVAHEAVPFLVTVSPYEAQDYLDVGDDIVEPVAMPEMVFAFVQDFVERHHVDEQFHKRKRKKWAESAGAVGLRSSKPSGEEG